MRKIMFSLPIMMILIALVLGEAAWAESQTIYLDNDRGESDLLSPEELDELAAPIALYPDPLIAQILPAATFVDQIKEAALFVRRNGKTSAIDSKPWDVSVKAVAHYPDVLFMMDERDDWTAALGQAFVRQQQGLFDAIQRLREEAREQGNLYSTPEQEVLYEDNVVTIVPASPEYLYVPVYNPTVVYVQPYDPFYPFVTFGVGFTIGAWLNRDCDWHRHRVYYHGWRGRQGWVTRARPHVHDRHGVYIGRQASVVRVNRSVVQRDTRQFQRQLRDETTRRREQRGARTTPPVSARPRPGRIERPAPAGAVQPRPGRIEQPVPGRTEQPRPGVEQPAPIPTRTETPRPTRIEQPRPGGMGRPPTRMQQPRPSRSGPRSEQQPMPGTWERRRTMRHPTGSERQPAAATGRQRQQTAPATVGTTVPPAATVRPPGVGAQPTTPGTVQQRPTGSRGGHETRPHSHGWTGQPGRPSQRTPGVSPAPLTPVQRPAVIPTPRPAAPSVPRSPVSPVSPAPRPTTVPAPRAVVPTVPSPAANPAPSAPRPAVAPAPLPSQPSAPSAPTRVAPSPRPAAPSGRQFQQR